MTMTITITMANNLLNINVYSDSAKYSLELGICKKIIFYHEYKFMPGDYN